VEQRDLPDKDKELDDDREVAVGISELLVEGLIEFQGDAEFKLTGKGIDYAYHLFHELSPKDQLALTLLIETIKEISETEGD